VHDVDVTRRAVGKLESKFPGRIAAGSADPGDAAASAFAGDVVTVPELTPVACFYSRKRCQIQTGIDMFQGNLRLTADFFATAKNRDNPKQ
jgi:hypothetical protein